MTLREQQRVRVDIPARPGLGRIGGTVFGTVLGCPKADEHVLVIPEGCEGPVTYLRACWAWVTPLEPQKGTLTDDR